MLKEMKKNAEERADKALNQSRYEITSLDDLIVRFDESKELNEQPILNIENVNIFLGVSKEYLKIFEPLNDYIYCNYYSKSYADFFSKNFDVADKSLIFCKELIDWIMGTKKFPLKKLNDFYNSCDLGLSSYKTDILDFLRNSIKDKNYKKNKSIKIVNKMYEYDFYNAQTKF